jgi:para-aminobenzoate synthetase/4-amino-4-deoxychorismate lyase
MAPWSLHPGVSPGLGRHKWVDRSPLESLPGGPWGHATDPLLVDGHEMVLEAGRGNVFVIHDDVVTTPPLDGRILPGIVRAEVVGLLPGLHVMLRECPVSLAALADADEVFVTSSIGGVRAVAVCSGIGTWSPGAVTERIRNALELAWTR